MKRILILTLALLSSAVAFSQKIGHIDRAALIKIMPETTTVDTKLQTIQAEYVTALQEMEADYNRMIEDYKKNFEIWPAAIRESKVKAIQDKETQMSEFQQTASTDIQTQQELLYQPLIDKAGKAIEDVAKENGFIYIIDSGLGVLLYTGGEDIMPLVKTKLNITDAPSPVAPK